MSFAFARLDIQSWLPRTQTLLPLAFIAAVGIILPVPGIAVVASAIVTILLVSAPFLSDERNRLNTLYGILPVSRTSVVIGRTIALLALNLIAVAIANITTIAVATVRDASLDPQVLLIANAVAFAIVGLAMTLQLPVFFRIGYSRGRLIAYAPALVIAGLAWLGQETGIITSNASLPAAVPPLIGVCIAAGVLGITAGTLLALGQYRRRELN